MKRKAKWHDAKKEKPKPGELCLVYYPLAEYGSGHTCGKTATCFYRENEGWIMSDTPVKCSFEPDYWMFINSETFKRKNLP